MNAQQRRQRRRTLGDEAPVMPPRQFCATCGKRGHGRVVLHRADGDVTLCTDCRLRAKPAAAAPAAPGGAIDTESRPRLGWASDHQVEALVDAFLTTSAQVHRSLLLYGECSSPIATDIGTTRAEIAADTHAAIQRILRGW